jgi:hypothetical protein
MYRLLSTLIAAKASCKALPRIKNCAQLFLDWNTNLMPIIIFNEKLLYEDINPCSPRSVHT